MARYRSLNNSFDKGFRNDLNQNFTDIERDIIRNENEIKRVETEATSKVDLVIKGGFIESLESARDSANASATSATTQATYAKTQGDGAKTQADYAKAQGEYALTKGNYADEKAVLANNAAANANQESSNLGQLKIDVVDATQAANTAATEASTQSVHAKTQGDYAGEKGQYAENKAVELEDRLNNAIAETTNSAEIIDARGSHTTLRERLDDTTAQLAQNAKDLEERGINIKKFGAKSTVEESGFDNTQAFIDAINYANNQGGKVTIFIPHGEYLINSGDLLPEITGFDVWFKGAERQVTTLVLSSGTYFKFGKDTGLLERGGLADLTVKYNTMNADSVVVLSKNCSGQIFKNVRAYNTATFLLAGTVDYKSYSQRFINCSVALGNLGKPFIKLVNGAGLYWEDGSSAYVSGVNPPVEQNDMTTLPGTDFIAIEGNWDTVRVKTFLERFYRGIYVNATVGRTILNIKLDSCLFDYIREKSIDVQVTGGTVAGVEILNSKFNSWENHCIDFYSTGFCKGISLVNVSVNFSGGSGVRFAGNPNRFSLENVSVKGVRRKVLSGEGIVIGSGLQDFKINNCEVGGDVSDAGVTWGASCGIVLSGNNDKYILSNNKSHRYSITHPTGYTETEASKTRIAVANLFVGSETDYKYDGLKTSGRYTLPLNAEKWYNTTPYTIEVTIFGGTVTQIIKENITMPTQTTFSIEPGEWFSVYYSVAPNVRFFVKP